MPRSNLVNSSKGVPPLSPFCLIRAITHCSLIPRYSLALLRKSRCDSSRIIFVGLNPQAMKQSFVLLHRLSAFFCCVYLDHIQTTVL
ncbi:tRNA (uracil(54)-C(5))-methyltransferase [Gossypium arboreum]|uniref:tRNA (Uracil(54)-C(5))-methyltransferase n=1 Tax=Gossypium arboreum TaxID=29729 RepID=A0A0B0MAU6_GOSAR|nr:tRNA (uracil(54)-C(5))-methyltransferase [Gossypium arboreum]